MKEQINVTSAEFSDLDMFEFRLLCHYRFIAQQGRTRVTVRESAAAAGMSFSKVIACRKSLLEKGYLADAYTHTTHATEIQMA